MASDDTLPTTAEVRDYWNRSPVGDAHILRRETAYDYFREFDNLREAEDCEPYWYSNRIHGYTSSRGLKVLDYGCGNGYVLAQYARHGAEVYGVDVTETAVRLSRERFELLGLDGTFVVGDGTSVPFESNTFDVVCSMGVLHHIPNPEPVVAELHRVLRPGGKLIVMLYNRRSFRYHVLFPFRARFGPEKFRGRSLAEQVNLNDGAGNPLGRVYSRDEARALLRDFERHEFQVSKLGVAELALFDARLEPVVRRALPRRVVAALARRYGWNLYCTAYKPHG